MQKERFSRGFTLIELLIVVAIIAILAAIAIPNMLEAQVRAKTSRAKSDMRTIATALESYLVDYNRYPPNFDAGDYVTPVPASEYMTYACLSTPVAYLSSAPMDPFRLDPNEPTRGRYYDFVGADTVETKDTYTAPLKAFWANKSVRWSIASCGPDSHNQELGKHLDEAALFTYDPSNGSVSPGDFGRTNIASVPAS